MGYNTIALIESSGSELEVHKSRISALLVRRKATRGTYLSTVAQGWEDERI